MRNVEEEGHHSTNFNGAKLLNCMRNTLGKTMAEKRVTAVLMLLSLIVSGAYAGIIGIAARILHEWLPPSINQAFL